MITSILSLMLAQVGPNPNVSEPITPPEVAEQRRQTAERDHRQHEPGVTLLLSLERSRRVGLG